MTLYIGDIPISYVSSFNTDHGSKNIEEIAFIGENVVPYLSESRSKLLDFEMNGTLLEESGDPTTLDNLAERILAIKDRRAQFNYIHDFQSRSGWIGLKEGRSDKNAHSLVTRPYSMEGKFLPKNSYQPRMHSYPIILTNDFSLTLGTGGCDNYIPIPIGATYSGGDGSTITRVGKDGTTTLVKATTNSDIKWDLDADEVDVGECKCWDTVIVASTTESDWIRIFNPDHVFAGDCIIENGLTRLRISLAQTLRQASTYISSTWLDTWTNEIYERNTAGYNLKMSFFGIKSISADEIQILGNGYASSHPNVRCDVVWAISRGSYIIHLNTPDVSTIRHDFNFSSTHGWVGGIKISDTVLAISEAGTPNYAIMINTAVAGIGILASALSKNCSLPATGSEVYILSTTDAYEGFIPFANAANLHKECEDMSQGPGVTFYTGVDASPKTGNTGSILDAQNENVYYEFTGGTDLPLGTYKLFVRAKDSDQVADDISCLVRNTTDSTDVMAKTTKTLTGSWAYYAFDVTIASDDDTDTIRVTLNKETATANTIDLDYVLWVPITLDSGNGPQDIVRQAMVDQRVQRELIQR